MSNDNMPIVEAEVPGIGKLRAQGIFGDRALLVIVIAGIAVSLYWHDSAGREDTRKILAELVALREATAENTYVLSLGQADRERLAIVMPESLRRKLRKADQ